MLDALLDQLQRTHDGDPWYGSPRMHFLRGLPASDAARRPPGCAHSIWELVLHMTAWTSEVRRRLAGSAPAAPSEGDWPPVPEPATDAAWSATLADLERAHKALLADARRLRAEELARVVGEDREPALGTGVTVGAMLVGLAQHDAYHTGQLAVQRRLVEHSRALGARGGAEGVP